MSNLGYVYTGEDAAVPTKTIDIIKATAPVVEPKVVDIVTDFYGKLFKSWPQVMHKFNMSNQVATPNQRGMSQTLSFSSAVFEGRPESRCPMSDPTPEVAGGQRMALAKAIIAYASNIENLGKLGPTVRRIAIKHVALRIYPHEYVYVGSALLAAIREVLGDAVTPDVSEAWMQAYWLLADILIKEEKTMYQALGDAPGGWNGLRSFVVKKMEPACPSGIMKSIYLVPKDGKDIIAQIPGQFLTLRLNIDGIGLQYRNYTISSQPGSGHYRITIKAIGSASRYLKPGLASNFLHDLEEGAELEVGPPLGDFNVPDDVLNSDQPLIFIAAGVGITPIIAQLAHTLEKQQHSTRPIYFFNSVKNESEYALRSELEALKGGDNFHYHVVSTREKFDGAEWTHIDHSFLGRNGPEGQWDATSAFMCGPQAFMKKMETYLVSLGVKGSNIHVDNFGPVGA